MFEEILPKILTNTASETEKVLFFQFLENDPKKKEEFYQYKNLYAVSSLNQDENTKLKNENFEKFWNQVNSERTTISLRQWIKYAAVVLIASTVGFLSNSLLKDKNDIISENHVEYSSEKGSVSIIKLNDGSIIWLSSGTQITIDKTTEGKTTAKLNGEAYFDLKPNPRRNFIVDLGAFQVKDIGTQFNVRAYSSENKISTSLVSGQIDLIEESGNALLSLKPGEYAEYDKNRNSLVINQHDPSEITAWKDGKFVFINEPLEDICRELERWYNIEINIEDQALTKIRYSSVVKRSTTVEMVLKYLSVTDKIKYEIINKKEGKDIIKIRK